MGLSVTEWLAKHTATSSRNQQIKGHKTSTSRLVDLPKEIITEIASYMTIAEASGFASYDPKITDSVEHGSWRHYCVSLAGGSQGCTSLVPGVNRGQSIQGGWKQLQKKLKDRPQRAGYIRSLAFVANSSSITIATETVNKLFNLNSVISHCGYTPNTTKKDDTAFLAIIGGCGTRLSICKLDVSLTKVSQNTLLCALQNLPNLVHLETAYTIPHGRDEGNLLLIAPALPRLKTLSLSADTFPDYGISIVRAAPQLSKLILKRDFSGVSTKAQEALKEMLQSEQIRVLETEQHSWKFLTTCDSIVPDPLPKLEILTVAGNVSALKCSCPG